MSAKNMLSVTIPDNVNVKITGIAQQTAPHLIKPNVMLHVKHVMAQESMIVWNVSQTQTATTVENANVIQTGELTTAPTLLELATIAVKMDVPDQLPSSVEFVKTTQPRMLMENVYATHTGLVKIVPSIRDHVPLPVWNVLVQLPANVFTALSMRLESTETAYV
jgi:hypothetical protein